MKTQVVYVLTSTEKDIYLEQAYVSMCSLKHYVPNAHIVLLTDNTTKSTFTGIREKEIKYADEIIVVDLDAVKYNGQKRSRILKTNVRKYVKGDFLFIDCDTIITKSLEEIDNIDADIAACWDTHSLFIDNPYRKMCIEHARLLGWNIEKENEYFNSGVVYVKDTPITHQFYEHWNKNWFDGLSKGVKMDQPAFALTNYQMNHIIKTLPDIWNCELKHGIKYLKDAFIVHYLCTNASKGQDKQLFILNEEKQLLQIKETGEIPPEIMETIKDPFYGIARLTHCFAGEDVYYFNTFGHSFLRKNYHWGNFETMDDKVRLLKKIITRKKMVVSLFKKLNLK